MSYSKFKNKIVYVDGIKFLSEKEGNRYKELKLLLRANVIKDLELQKKYLLQDGFVLNGKKIQDIEYIADFCYYDNEKKKWIVEDVKASKYFQTQIYRLKKKLFMYKYQMEILET